MIHESSEDNIVPIRPGIKIGSPKVQEVERLREASGQLTVDPRFQKNWTVNQFVNNLIDEVAAKYRA